MKICISPTLTLLLIFLISVMISPRIHAAPPRLETEISGQMVDDYESGKYFGSFVDAKGTVLDESVVEASGGNQVMSLDYKVVEGGYAGVWHKLGQTFENSKQDWSTATELRLHVFTDKTVQLKITLYNEDEEVGDIDFEVFGGSGKWSEVALPLSTFNGVQGGISSVTQFNLNILTQDQGVIYLDNLYVLTDSEQSSSVTHPGAVLATVSAVDAFAAALASIPEEVSGRTLHVSSMLGDMAGDGSDENPFGSIQQAVDVALPGDTVIVAHGTYVEQAVPNQRGILIRRSGRPGAPITIRAAEGAEPLIVSDGWAVIGIEDAMHVRIEGLRITGGVNAEVGHNTVAGVMVSRSAHIEIVGNHLHDLGGGGVGTMHSDYVTIEGNRIERTAFRNIYNTSGISLFEIRDLDEKPGFHNVIRNNICIDNQNTGPTPLYGGKLTDGNGIIVDHHRGEGEILIENNLLVNNGGRGISFFRAHNATVRHNTSIWNGWTPDSDQADATAVSSDRILYVNNLFVARPGSTMSTSWKQGPEVVYRNNVFAGFDSFDLAGSDSSNYIVPADRVVFEFGTVDSIEALTSRKPGDFRITRGSAGSGKADASFSPAKDLLWISRDLPNVTNDIGALVTPR